MVATAEGVLRGATGGFLLGMLVAAIVLGMLAKRGSTNTRARTLAARLVATVIIFVSGVTWLSTLVSWQAAVTTGLLPFVGSEAAKIALAGVALPTRWRLARMDGEGDR